MWEAVGRDEQATSRGAERAGGVGGGEPGLLGEEPAHVEWHLSMAGHEPALAGRPESSGLRQGNKRRRFAVALAQVRTGLLGRECQGAPH